MPHQPNHLSRPGLAHLAVVYVVWGSTYLAIRVAVREDAGFPPFAMAFMRVALASTILLVWALGSIWLQRRKPDLSVRVISGYQHLLGGVSLLAASIATREPLPTPTGEAWLAFCYLVLFGSVFAFTSYMATIRLLPYRVVVTYSYANPVIAVFLGWLILRESVTGWTLAGALLVVAGVAGVFANRE
jgi:drug/metabolite transporter (DMT)-like permease